MFKLFETFSVVIADEDSIGKGNQCVCVVLVGEVVGLQQLTQYVNADESEGLSFGSIVEQVCASTGESA